MRNIKKQQPSAEFNQYKRGCDATYNNLPGPLKQQLKQSLLHEQDAICCYCMRRIQPDTLRVEHWRSQKRYPELQLDYGNILAACPGRIGEGKHAETICDVRKKDRDILYNPACDDVQSKLSYKKDGAIASNDAAFDNQINSILNLNCALLKNNRAKIYELFTERTKHWTPASIQKMQNNIAQNPKSPEYSGLKRYFLRKWLQRMQKRK